MSPFVAVLLAFAATGPGKPVVEEPMRAILPPASPAPVPRLRRLEDVPINPSATLDQFVVRWGQPIRMGPMNVLLAYRLSPKDELWLSFEEVGSRRLTRAILLHTISQINYPRVLMDRLQWGDARHCSQLDFTQPLTEAQVTAVWGPPDGVQGPDRQIWTYKMANHGGANVVFNGAARASNCDD